jgi:uncharacterized protein (UPF0335 family)
MTGNVISSIENNVIEKIDVLKAETASVSEGVKELTLDMREDKKLMAEVVKLMEKNATSTDVFKSMNKPYKSESSSLINNINLSW